MFARLTQRPLVLLELHVLDLESCHTGTELQQLYTAHLIASRTHSCDRGRSLQVSLLARHCT